MFDLNTNLLFSVHGGADSGGGVAGVVAGFLSFVEGLLALSPAEMFANLMPGLAAMANMHPLFVHFPMALLSLFLLLDLLGTWTNKHDWRRAAGWFLYCGTVFAFLTVAAGLIAARSVAHGGDVHEIMESHEHLGISVLLLATSLAIWRWIAKGQIFGPANTLYLLCATILAALLMFTADLGGLMVYKFGVAVEPVAKINQAAVAQHQHGGDAVMHEQKPVAAEPTEPVEHQHDHAHHDHSH
jgi:uncharacterized membrane protein